MTVDFTTADLTLDEQSWYGPGATEGVDYAKAVGTLTFLPGQPLSQKVTVQVNGDRDSEPDELFFVKLSNPSGARLAATQATGSIVNDKPYVWFESDVSQPEGNVGQTAMTFKLYLSAPYDIPVSVDYFTADLTMDEQSWYGPGRQPASITPPRMAR